MCLVGGVNVTIDGALPTDALVPGTHSFCGLSDGDEHVSDAVLKRSEALPLEPLCAMAASGRRVFPSVPYG